MVVGVAALAFSVGASLATPNISDREVVAAAVVVAVVAAVVR